jgi:hypothetical protein
VDLSLLDDEIARREPTWAGGGLSWEVVRGPRDDRPAAWLWVNGSRSAVSLMVWESGKAELGVVSAASTDDVIVGYEFDGPADLTACVDEIERHLGLGR